MLPFWQSHTEKFGAEFIYRNDFREDDIYEQDETNDGADAHEPTGCAWFCSTRY